LTALERGSQPIEDIKKNITKKIIIKQFNAGNKLSEYIRVENKENVLNNQSLSTQKLTTQPFIQYSSKTIHKRQ